jgi:hypothetical protein
MESGKAFVVIANVFMESSLGREMDIVYDSCSGLGLLVFDLNSI